MRMYSISDERKAFVLIEIDAVMNEENAKVAKTKLMKALDWVEEAHQNWRHLQPRDIIVSKGKQE